VQNPNLATTFKIHKKLLPKNQAQESTATISLLMTLWGCLSGDDLLGPTFIGLIAQGFELLFAESNKIEALVAFNNSSRCFKKPFFWIDTKFPLLYNTSIT
jgi:hypothetical protein